VNSIRTNFLSAFWDQNSARLWSVLKLFIVNLSHHLLELNLTFGTSEFWISFDATTRWMAKSPRTIHWHFYWILHPLKRRTRASTRRPSID
jgi:hypothetical protein